MSKGSVICVKCGARANTKCPHTRTIFPSDQMATMLGNLIDVDVYDEEWEDWDREKNTTHKVKMVLEICAEKGKEIEQLIETLKSMSDYNLAEILCNHDWKLMPGFESGSADCSCSWEGLSDNEKTEIKDAMKKFPDKKVKLKT